ncbi:hypothetical protein BGZ65_005448, partial [Modicella reniformis]
KNYKTLCWNPKAGEIISELEMDIAWSACNPDSLASALFDDHRQHPQLPIPKVPTYPGYTQPATPPALNQTAIWTQRVEMTHSDKLATQKILPSERRLLDYAEKKLDVLFDILNKEGFPVLSWTKILLLTQALQVKNYNSAYQIHLEQQSTRTDEVSG